MKKEFVFSRYYDHHDIENYSEEDTKTVHIKKNDLKKLTRGDILAKDLFFDEEFLLKLYFDEEYKMTVDDLIYALKMFRDRSFKDFKQWYFEMTDFEADSYFHIRNRDFVWNDFLCEHDSTLIDLIFSYFSIHLPREKFEVLIDNALEIIDDVLKNRNDANFGIKASSLITWKISFFADTNKIELDPSIIQYFKTRLLELCNVKDVEALKTLGYQYYSGSQAFPHDDYLAEKYLFEAYEIDKDPWVARTLGYIYYYGKTNNGTPLMDKAFHYFAISYFCSKSHEAAYKLADCYLHGYGTLQSEEAAYKLVDSIYDDSYDTFLNGIWGCKYADVSLRLAGFYNRGTYLKQDYRLALLFYRSARYAIRKRIEYDECVGDIGVATNIFKSIQDMENKTGFKTKRKILHKGYVLNFNSEFIQENRSMEFNEFYADKKGLHIICKATRVMILDDIGYVERCHSAHFIFTCKNLNNVLIQKELKNSNMLLIEDNHLKFNCSDVEINYDKIVYVPFEIFDVKKKYHVVRCEFYDGSKQYDYLLDDNIKVSIGERLVIDTNGSKKIAIAKEIFELYEDELALPVDRFTKANKIIRIKIENIEKVLKEYGIKGKIAKDFFDSVEKYFFNKNDKNIIEINQNDLKNELEYFLFTLDDVDCFMDDIYKLVEE